MPGINHQAQYLSRFAGQTKLPGRPASSVTGGVKFFQQSGTQQRGNGL